MSNESWLFPQSFYGNHIASHRWWRRTLKELWKTRSWSEVLKRVPLIDVRATSGDILYEVASHGVTYPHREDKHWFLSWVADDRPYDVFTAADDVVLADQELVVQGLEHLWYTIGHLGKHAMLPKPIGNRDRRSRTALSIHRHVAVAVARWLPEINELAGRLAVSGFAADFQGLNPSLPMWLNAVGFTFGWAKFRSFKPDEWWHLYDVHQGDAIKFLQAAEVIEKEGDRYRPLR